MNFEWDDGKAIANWQKHGIEFMEAIHIFNDPLRSESYDGREAYGEDRFITIGYCEGVELTIVYTLRKENIRIISARKAEPHERRIYWENR